LRAGNFRRCDNGGHVEIAVLGRRRSDADALVGQAHVHRRPIGGRVHRDGLDAQFATGAQNTQRDFAAVGDEDFVEHLSANPQSQGFRRTQRAERP